MRVEDDGVGIPTQRREQVFEPFFSADPLYGAPGAGDGLGLTLVRYPAAAHGASVCLASPPGGGAAFDLRFPLAADAAFPLLRADPLPFARDDRYAPLHVILSDLPKRSRTGDASAASRENAQN